jgi:large repetitive protein
MEACVQPSDPTRRRRPSWAPGVVVVVAALGLAPAAGLGCSPQRLQVVDTDPCLGGDNAMCISPGLLDGVVGYWRLDDGAGSSAARDGSGRGNNGTLLGVSSASAWVPGRSGMGLAINAQGWVMVTPSVSLDAVSDRLTVAGWVYLDGPIAEWGTLLSREIGGTIDQHYHLSLNADRRPNLFVTTATMHAIIAAPTAVAPRTWVHLAGTYDGTAARLYVDGTLAISTDITGTIAGDTTPLILGGNGNDATGLPTELFPGRIDEIMLYRRALSADEISRLRAGELFGATTPAGDAGTD